MQRSRRAVSGAVTVGLVLLAGGVLTACGAPAYTYVSDKAENAYFKVPTAESLLDASSNPVVYASVQNMKLSLRGELSFDVMRDLIFPVTPSARQEAAAAGEKLLGFTSIGYTLITNKYDMRGINEVFEYNVEGQPNAFDLTVLTNAGTTKLYLLLIQCYQACFAAHESQILAVANSFTVRGL
jgi:hypothetical protein